MCFQRTYIFYNFHPLNEKCEREWNGQTEKKSRKEKKWNEMNKYKSQWMASGHEQSEWSTFNRIDNERDTQEHSQIK